MLLCYWCCFFCCKQKTAYDMRTSDWSSDVCSSDLKGRESTLMGLADGSIDILVGTHAIFQQAVGYRDLALVVVDEQHRFGVAQRLMLTDKGARPPHLLVMTARSEEHRLNSRPYCASRVPCSA